MTIAIYLSIIAITIIAAILSSLLLVSPTVKHEFSRKMKTDITIEEMRGLETNIQKFYLAHNLKDGETIQKVAEVLNVVDAGGVDHLGSRARIYESDAYDKKTVVHNNAIPSDEWMFDFAHELGHQINGDPTPADRPIGFNKPKVDQLADYTAAALIMPIKHVQQFLIVTKYEQASPRKRVSLVKKIAHEYHVSETLAVRRINEVRMLTNNKNK